MFSPTNQHLQNLTSHFVAGENTSNGRNTGTKKLKNKGTISLAFVDVFTNKPTPAKSNNHFVAGENTGNGCNTGTNKQKNKGTIQNMPTNNTFPGSS